MIVFANQVKQGETVELLGEVMPLQIEVLTVEAYEHSGFKWVDITSKPKTDETSLTAITVTLTMLADSTLNLVDKP